MGDTETRPRLGVSSVCTRNSGFVLLLGCETADVESDLAKHPLRLMKHRKHSFNPGRHSCDYYAGSNTSSGTTTSQVSH